MIKKRPLLVAALIICLTLTIFIVSSTGYDPWIDYDEDGTVDYDDFILLAGEYGTSGDPTKNVSVTNWPEPQKPIFPETLVLRGTSYWYHQIWEHGTNYYEWQEWKVLLDEDSPYPPLDTIYNESVLWGYPTFMPTEWTKSWYEERVNFTHQAYMQTTCFVQGDVIIRPTISYYLDNSFGVEDIGYFNVTVHFEKVDVNMVSTVLASDTARINSRVPAFDSVSYRLQSIGFTFKFPLPVVIEPGDRLQIRFETWARCDQGQILSELYLHHEVGTDEFIAIVPIA